MGINRRRDPRYFVRMRVAIIRAKEVTWLETDNVSLRGVFVKTDAPPAMRELLQVKFVLPGQTQHITFSGMAVHIVQPQQARDDRPAGCGIQFYGVGGVDGTRWQHFVREIRQNHAAALERHGMIDFVPHTEGEPAKKLTADHSGRIRVRVGSTDALYNLYEKNILKGALMIPTEGDLPLGKALEILLVHPQSGATYPLTGVVRKNFRRGQSCGAAVQLTAMTPRAAAELLEFVNSDIPLSISGEFEAA